MTHRSPLRSTALGLIAGAALAAPAAAEIELNLYTGYQTSPHSRIDGTYPGGGSYSALIGWQGKSFEMPPYYGARATWWKNERWGFGVEFTHAKVYAPEGEMKAAGFDRLEFTDGLNLITLNATRRWKDQWGSVTPYLGAGVGIAVPHVDATPTGGPKTFGYQMTGPAARLTAGASYQMTERWSVFGEYQFTWSDNSADLDGGGTLDTRILTNSVNFGVGLKF
ncbi:outer membrane protein [Pseudooceanicola aestuarii]|uniref:outer membrane protein n=1 Tax=Pseudooceanicola aestuarii TaxID=2697319 RepID=UPI0013D08F26|nr:outer membrane beta-barrel protein [Pseudooceanicola aestuarii]